MYKYLLLIAMLLGVACQPASEETVAEDPAPMAESASPPSAGLAAVLEAQPDDVKARYQYRHPQETLDFFGMEPGMVVLEGLPGRGWYTQILLAHLGSDGHIIASNYSMDMWPLFFFATEEFLADMADWENTFLADAEEWRNEDSATVSAFSHGSMPANIAGTVDVVFFARVLHNLANFQNAGEADFLDDALADAYAALKPGGVFGVVQHHARDEMSEEFANGTHGYLKKDWLIAQIEAAGFEFVAESDINANALDQPTEEDIVWRLPPSYNGTGDDPELKAAVDAVGESNRMTLKFRKPE